MADGTASVSYCGAADAAALGASGSRSPTPQPATSAQETSDRVRAIITHGRHIIGSVQELHASCEAAPRRTRHKAHAEPM